MDELLEKAGQSQVPFWLILKKVYQCTSRAISLIILEKITLILVW